MVRKDYRLWSPTTVGSLPVSNCLVRAATWDPSILPDRRMKPAVVNLHRVATEEVAG